jgi:pilus assembly protein TadC
VVRYKGKVEGATLRYTDGLFLRNIFYVNRKINGFLGVLYTRVVGSNIHLGAIYSLVPLMVVLRLVGLVLIGGARGHGGGVAPRWAAIFWP